MSRAAQWTTASTFTKSANKGSSFGDWPDHLSHGTAHSLSISEHSFASAERHSSNAASCACCSMARSAPAAAFAPTLEHARAALRAMRTMRSRSSDRIADSNNAAWREVSSINAQTISRMSWRSPSARSRNCSRSSVTSRVDRTSPLSVRRAGDGIGGTT
jgi:hypothetical protein